MGKPITDGEYRLATLIGEECQGLATSNYLARAIMIGVRESRGEDKLQAHFAKMQRMASAYLEPGPYIDREGREWRDLDDIHGFVADMIWMLDGPEQRKAQKP